MFRRFALAQLLVTLVATVPVLTACGADESPPLPAPAGANSALAGTLGNTNATGNGAAPCSNKQVRECRVELGQQGTVVNCFIGLQLCEEGTWGPCLSTNEIEAQLNSQ